jgi:hypothetical protein
VINGPALYIILAAALTWYVGTEAVAGAKWVGHEAKRAGHAIVHVLKKVPHP